MLLVTVLGSDWESWNGSGQTRSIVGEDDVTLFILRLALF